MATPRLFWQVMLSLLSLAIILLFILHNSSNIAFLNIQPRPLTMTNIENFERALGRIEATEKKLPGAVIMGIKKCGTGALIELLRMHPEIAVPNYHETEVRFWADDDEYLLGLEHYKAQMPLAAPDQMAIVKAPGILTEKENNTGTRMHLERLKQVIPDVKILMVVKNPIDRLVSHIVHEFVQPGGHQGGKIMPDVDDIIMGRAGYIEGVSDTVFHLSNYTLQYQLVSAVFKDSQLMVVDGEQLVKDPIAELRKVEQFLGIQTFFTNSLIFYPEQNKGFPCFLLNGEGKCMEKDKGRKHPKLKTETLDFLLTIFQPMMETFQEETGIYFDLNPDEDDASKVL